MQLRQYDCASARVCTRLRTLWSSSVLHYSFGWQSRGPHPLALPHHTHSHCELQQQPVCIRDPSTGVNLPQDHRRTRLDWVNVFPRHPLTPTDFWPDVNGIVCEMAVWHGLSNNPIHLFKHTHICMNEYKKLFIIRKKLRGLYLLKIYFN